MRAVDHAPLRIAAALAFVASAAVTVTWATSMAAMPDMPMPGGWTMSMAWMRMPGQGWFGSAATFVGMWAVMMIAMMLPAFVPMLARYRAAIYPRRPSGLLWRATAGYFAVWTTAGALAYLPGVALAALAMHAPAVARAAPVAGALILLLAGCAQLGGWKARRLADCREDADCCARGAATPSGAWRHGLRLGIRCLRCCAPLTAALLVMGVMDLCAMGLVTVAVTLERLSVRGERVARGSGVILWLSGLALLVRAIE